MTYAFERRLAVHNDDGDKYVLEVLGEHTYLLEVDHRGEEAVIACFTTDGFPELLSVMADFVRAERSDG